MFSPVCGLRSWRAARVLVVKGPKPGMTTRSSRGSTSAIAASTANRPRYGPAPWRSVDEARRRPQGRSRHRRNVPGLRPRQRARRHRHRRPPRSTANRGSFSLVRVRPAGAGGKAHEEGSRNQRLRHAYPNPLRPPHQVLGQSHPRARPRRRTRHPRQRLGARMQAPCGRHRRALGRSRNARSSHYCSGQGEPSPWSGSSWLCRLHSLRTYCRCVANPSELLANFGVVLVKMASNRVITEQ